MCCTLRETKGVGVACVLLVGLLASIAFALETVTSYRLVDRLPIGTVLPGKFVSPQSLAPFDRAPRLKHVPAKEE